MTQNLSDIKALLDAFGLKPKHRFGQNFLHDAGKMSAIVEAARIEPGDVVLEVGAGTGALSCRLLDAGASLIAVEIDTDLEPILRRQLAPYGERVAIIVQDVLSSKHRLSEPVDAALRPAERFKLVANLPYNVASPLIVNLITDYPRMPTAVVSIQREVAQRLTAEPGCKAYGPLGIMVQAFCHVERVVALPPGCFWPTPKVDSLAVRITRRAEPLTCDPQGFAAMLHKLFSKRRKQLGAILGRDRPWPKGVEPAHRPEQLTIEQLIELMELPAESD